MTSTSPGCGGTLVVAVPPLVNRQPLCGVLVCEGSGTVRHPTHPVYSCRRRSRAHGSAGTGQRSGPGRRAARCHSGHRRPQRRRLGRRSGRGDHRHGPAGRGSAPRGDDAVRAGQRGDPRPREPRPGGRRPGRRLVCGARPPHPADVADRARARPRRGRRPRGPPHAIGHAAGRPVRHGGRRVPHPRPQRRGRSGGRLVGARDRVRPVCAVPRGAGLAVAAGPRPAALLAQGRGRHPGRVPGGGRLRAAPDGRVDRPSCSRPSCCSRSRSGRTSCG